MSFAIVLLSKFSVTKDVFLVLPLNRARQVEEVPLKQILRLQQCDRHTSQLSLFVTVVTKNKMTFI